jgi:hypothetical protein
VTFLRFTRILSLALWLGGFFFFGAVVAPTLFTAQPSHALAGLIVGISLHRLHWIGMICALLFLLAGVLMALLQSGASPFRRRELLLAAMLAITCYLQFSFEPRMIRLRDSMGIIDNVPVTDARRVEFNRLHEWSTKLEGSVFFLGVALLYLEVRDRESRMRRY